MVVRCETCVYRGIPDNTCRRFPPQCYSASSAARFPVIALDEWCGEHRMPNKTPPAPSQAPQPNRPK